ncbi:uncharacterized protein LOC127714661 [Mytilus californianus]|uniref:uncharacterized protein LOC127714661 n=1 Tax=Mytilus californianus TaxID=6549 RepID=UPI002247292E|nr:uncharacterized protein LOC127714661 [Mytilus californianus]
MPHLIEKSTDEQSKKIKRFRRPSFKEDNEYMSKPALQPETEYLFQQQFLELAHWKDLDNVNKKTKKHKRKLRPYGKRIDENTLPALQTETEYMDHQYHLAVAQNVHMLSKVEKLEDLLLTKNDEIDALRDYVKKNRQKQKQITNHKHEHNEIDVQSPAIATEKKQLETIEKRYEAIISQKDREIMELINTLRLYNRLMETEYLKHSTHEMISEANSQKNELIECVQSMDLLLSKKDGEIALLKQNVETKFNEIENLNKEAERKTTLMEESQLRFARLIDRERNTERENILLKLKLRNAKKKYLELGVDLTDEDGIFDIEEHKENMQQDLKSDTDNFSTCNQNQTVFSSTTSNLNSIRQITSEQHRIFHISANTVQISDNAPTTNISMNRTKSFDETNRQCELEESEYSQAIQN